MLQIAKEQFYKKEKEKCLWLKKERKREEELFKCHQEMKPQKKDGRMWLSDMQKKISEIDIDKDSDETISERESRLRALYYQTRTGRGAYAAQFQ